MSKPGPTLPDMPGATAEPPGIEHRPIPGGVAVRFDTSLRGVRLALSHVTGALRESDIAEGDLQTLELVLAEAMNNVVEHAYGVHDDGVIELEVTRLADTLRCVICDHGQPMPNARAPRGDLLPPGRIVVAPREGGFGWYLIRQLSIDLVYVRTGGSNRLIFHIPFGVVASPC